MFSLLFDISVSQHFPQFTAEGGMCARALLLGLLEVSRGECFRLRETLKHV